MNYEVQDIVGDEAPDSNFSDIVVACGIEPLVLETREGQIIGVRNAGFDESELPLKIPSLQPNNTIAVAASKCGVIILEKYFFQDGVDFGCYYYTVLAVVERGKKIILSDSGGRQNLIIGKLEGR